MRKHYTVEFVESDRIDDDSYDLVKQLFGLAGDFFLSNESTLDDFLEFSDIPGHSLKSLSEIPDAERKAYITDEHLDFSPELHLVWYPKAPEDVWERVHKEAREKLLKRIERIFGVSMDEYPEAELLVWKVNRYIGRKEHLS